MVKKELTLEERRSKCEVYARIVGYLRPTDQWNDGKYAEFYDRKTFDKVWQDL